MENVRCPICSCEFSPKTPDQAKCVTCTKLYPNASSLEELKDKDQANKDVPKMFSEDKLKSIVLSILKEIGLNLKVCENCSNSFIPRSPAQKFCSTCSKKSKDTKDKETKDIEKDSEVENKGDKE